MHRDAVPGGSVPAPVPAPPVRRSALSRLTRLAGQATRHPLVTLGVVVVVLAGVSALDKLGPAHLALLVGPLVAGVLVLRWSRRCW